MILIDYVKSGTDETSTIFILIIEKKYFFNILKKKVYINYDIEDNEFRKEYFKHWDCMIKYKLEFFIKV